jgi:hypothetical protein
MTTVLLAALAVALVACVLALGREMRLRRALEKLLRIILSRWRAHVQRTQPKDFDSVDDNSADPDQRL